MDGKETHPFKADENSAASGCAYGGSGGWGGADRNEPIHQSAVLEGKEYLKNWYCFACDSFVFRDHLQHVFDQSGQTGTCEMQSEPPQLQPVATESKCSHPHGLQKREKFMVERTCKYCGLEYDGKPCPERSNRMRPLPHVFAESRESEGAPKGNGDPCEIDETAVLSEPQSTLAAFHLEQEANMDEGELRFYVARLHTAFAALQQSHDKHVKECSELRAALNTPETNDFFKGIELEAAHQRLRWPSEHDAGKTHADWFWLVGYLAGKCLQAAIAGDSEKALHHTISTAAALANWHRAIKGFGNMRPGIDTPQDAALGSASEAEGKGATNG